MLSRLRRAQATRSLIVGTFATVGLLFGLVPDLSGRSNSFVFSSAAYAQNVSETEVTNYAQAVLSMEPARQTAFNQIKKMIGAADVPSIVCHKPESLNALPSKAQEIAVNYCNQSKDIVESNGLTITRFNTITVNMQNNPNLKTRIHNELLRLQNASASQ